MVTTLLQAFHLIGRDQRLRWVFLVALALVASAFEMLGAVLVFVLIGLVADPESAVELPVVGDVRSIAGDVGQETFLLGVIVVMGLFFLIRSFVQVGTVYVQQRVANNAGARLSNKLVEGYLRWPYEAHLKRNSSELIRNGHQAVQELVTQVFVPVIRVTAEAFLALGMLAVLVVIAPAATALAVLVVGGAGVLLLVIVQPRLKRIGRAAHRMQRETLGTLQQSLHGLRDIKLLGRERYFAKVYGRSRVKLARAKYLKSTMTELPHSIIELSLLTFILFYFGVTIVTGTDTSETLPVLGLFAYAGLRLQPSLQRIIGGINEIKFASAPLDDLHSDLLAVEKLPLRERPKTPLIFEDALILRDIRFRYGGADRDALRGINLTIRPGEQIGICGSTGGGKTTLVDIMSGLLEPTDGSVTVDGHELRDFARQWQRNLGVVPQMVFLTDDTLARNIALGISDGDIDSDALAEAVELAQLSDFITSLPDGLETVVGERGVRISGGQRQRIAIARALYQRPAVLIFDEGTSALDNETEASLMLALERLRGRHTIILIAHRLSTVRDSDQVVFIDQGRLAGLGTYEELLATSERFKLMSGTT